MKNKTLPENIAIAGAGIMGLMSAYILMRAFPETRITLYDFAGFPADNASFMAGGMIAPYSELDHLPQDFLPTGMESIRLWKEIAGTLETDFEFSCNGSLLISHSEDRHLLERFKSILPQDHDWREIGGNEIAALESSLSPQKFRQAIHIKNEAHLHPQKIMTALCTKIPDKKKEFMSLSKEISKYDFLIDCRGIKSISEEKDLRGVKGETLIVYNPEFALSRPVRLMHPRYPFYIVPRENHVFMIGATVLESNGNANVSIRSGMELMSALYSLHSSFAEAEILDMKAGIRPAYPDNIPRLTVEGNIIRANGLYRHGFLFAPVMAQAIAYYIAGTNYAFSPLFIKGDTNHADRPERLTA